MSKLYKGIIFNSTTVRALRGQLADTVRKNHIRTGVVSNHGKTEVQEALDAAGIMVDVVLGGFDLNRWGKYRKPEPDLLFVAAAKIGLETDDILSVVDCQRDSSASAAAGIDTVAYDPAGSREV